MVLSSETETNETAAAATLSLEILRGDGTVSQRAGVAAPSSRDGMVCQRTTAGFECKGVPPDWVPATPEDCCRSPTLWHAHFDGASMQDLEVAVRALNLEKRCPCPGVIVMGAALHDLLKRFSKLPISCPTCGDEKRLDRVARKTGRLPFFAEPGVFSRAGRVAALLDATNQAYPRATVACRAVRQPPRRRSPRRRGHDVDFSGRRDEPSRPANR